MIVEWVRWKAGRQWSVDDWVSRGVSSWAQHWGIHCSASQNPSCKKRGSPDTEASPQGLSLSCTSGSALLLLRNGAETLLSRYPRIQALPQLHIWSALPHSLTKLQRLEEENKGEWELWLLFGLGCCWLVCEFSSPSQVIWEDMSNIWENGYSRKHVYPDVTK